MISKTMCAMKKTLLLLLFGMICCTLSAQISNTLYFDKQNYRQHHLNPSFQPKGKLYVGVPVISTIAVGGGNTDLTLTDVFKTKKIDGQNKTFLFCDKNVMATDEFMDAIHGREQIHASYQIGLFDAGYRINKKLFVSFSINNKMESSISIPKEFFQFFFAGMENGEKFDFRLDKMSIAATIYTEYAGGISAKIDENLSLGAKAKFLVGNANMSSNLRNLHLTASEDEWQVSGSGNIRITTPTQEITVSETDRVSGLKSNGGKITESQGHGFSIDAGANYKITDELKISASVLDLGFLAWTGNIQELNPRENFSYKGVEYEVSEDNGKDGWWDPYKTRFKRMLKKNDDPKHYTTWLSTKLLVAGEYSLMNDKISIGALSKTYFSRKATREEFILSANFRPIEYFSGTFTYNLFDGWNNIGIGLTGNAGPINLYAAIDHIPLRYASMSGHKIPCYVRDTRITLGMGVIIGYKRNSRFDNF